MSLHQVRDLLLKAQPLNPSHDAEWAQALITLNALIAQGPVAWVSPSGAVYRTRFQAVENCEQVVTPLYAHPAAPDARLVEAIDALRQLVDPAGYTIGYPSSSPEAKAAVAALAAYREGQ